MDHHISAMDVVVFLALAVVVLFVAAWSLSPRLRDWIERPKYRFQKDVRDYDERSGS
ncbi:MAG TPA: hypothetical protein VMT15_14730 [Bryobacteraceae bacterium]|nr:hypothetical protein [Bryobacteraceae bacterium]